MYNRENRHGDGYRDHRVFNGSRERSVVEKLANAQKHTLALRHRYNDVSSILVQQKY